jgi:hypothetical protein
MPMGILFWILMILWLISIVFGGQWPYAIYATQGLLFVLLGLLGWKVYGAPLQ